MDTSFEISRIYEKQLSEDIRKERGIYYTPYTIVEYILDTTLGGHDVLKNPNPKVLDLCCGCGNFLLKAYDLLYDKFLDNLDNLREKYGEDFISEGTIGIYIVENCIFGVDTDNQALEVFQKQLIERLQVDNISGLVDYEKIKFNISCNDSLKIDFEEIFNVEYFDYIVGNPPYIGHKLIDADYKKFLYAQYKEVYRDKGDLYFCFYKKIVDLLKEGAVAGIITPRYFMQSPSGRLLRDYLVGNSKIETIVDFLGTNIFNNLGIASCIVIVEKKELKKSENYEIDVYRIIDEGIKFKRITHLNEYINGDNFEYLKVKIDREDESWIMVKEDDVGFYRQLEEKCEYVLEQICTSFQGIITGCDKAFVVDLEDVGVDKIDRDLLKKWVKNKGVEKYIINTSYMPNKRLIYANDIDDERKYSFVIENFLKLYEDKLKNRRECLKGSRKWYELQWGREKSLFERKKIMYPYKSRENRFAIDTEGYYSSADVYSFYINEDFKDEFSYEYLVGILNSKTYDRYFKIIGKEMGKKIFDYYPNKVMKLRIFKDKNYREIEALSKEIIELRKSYIGILGDLENGDILLQDKKISLLKEKDYLERRIDFLENRIEELIRISLNL